MFLPRHMLGVRLHSSSILLLGEYTDSLVKTELLIIRQNVLHVHNVFCKKWAPLADFIMYQISWVQTHRLLPIALSLLLRSLGQIPTGIFLIGHVCYRIENGVFYGEWDILGSFPTDIMIGDKIYFAVFYKKKRTKKCAAFAHRLIFCIALLYCLFLIFLSGPACRFFL